MLKHRDKLDIIADILSVASRNGKKTQIMYQANLSYKVMMKYLDKIVAAALLQFEHEQQCYVITEKGKKFLVAYNEYVKSSKGVEKRLNNIRKKKHRLEGLCVQSKEAENVPMQTA